MSKKEDNTLLWIIIIIMCVAIALFVFNSMRSDEFKSSYDSAYKEGYNIGRDVITGGRSSRDVDLCANSCESTNTVCVAFMSKNMEWRDCGLNCDCPEILKQCYNECEKLYR